MCDVVRSGFTGIGYDFRTVWSGNGTYAFAEAEFTREEMVPGGVAVVFLAGVADEVLFEGKVVVSCCIVCHGGQVLAAGGPKPAIRIRREDFCRVGTLEKLAPVVEDLFQHGVDLGVLEDRKAAWRGHGIVEESIHGKSNEAHTVCAIAPRWGYGYDVV